MGKPGSSSPIPPYTIINIDYPHLTFEEARALPLPPTPPELIRDNAPSTHDYTPCLPADDPILLAAIAKLSRMSAFHPEEDDVDR